MTFILNFYIIFRKMSSQNQNLHHDNNLPSIRRSHRARVPNNIYTQDITQPRRGSNLKDTKKKTSKVSESDQSLQNSKRVQNDSVRQDETQWIKCIIPVDSKTTRELYVEIIQPKQFKRNLTELYQNKALYLRGRHQYSNQDQSYPNEAPRKIKKKTSLPLLPQKSGLLDLLYEAAHKVANQDSQIQQKKNSKDYEQVQKQIYEKPIQKNWKKQNKQSKDDRQGKIIRAYVQDEKLIFQHSKRGNIEIPFNKKQTLFEQHSVQNINQNLFDFDQIKKKFEEYKKKLNTPLILI